MISSTLASICGRVPSHCLLSDGSVPAADNVNLPDGSYRHLFAHVFFARAHPHRIHADDLAGRLLIAADAGRSSRMRTSQFQRSQRRDLSTAFFTRLRPERPKLLILIGGLIVAMDAHRAAKQSRLLATHDRATGLRECGSMLAKSSHRLVRALGALLASPFITTSASAGVVVSNPYIGGGYSSVGEAISTSYGQTFQTPDSVNTQLDSFSFWVQSVYLAPSHLKGYVAEWNGSGIAGSVLFTSAELAVSSPTATELLVATGGLSLAAGKQYVFFLSASGLFDGIPDGVQMGFGSLPYANGSFVYDNSFGAFPGPSWSGCPSSFDCIDVAFTLQFSEANSTTIPEPSPLHLIALALLGAGVASRLRSKAQC